MSYISKEDVVKWASIIDVAEKNRIGLERVSSGNFDYRCTCPSKEHKGGTERTKSCYINSNDNNFYCFGCNAGYNVIDFYILCTDSCFSDAMFHLRQMVDPSKIGAGAAHPKRSNMPILIEISSFVRRYKAKHITDEAWMVNFSKKLDCYLSKIDRYDINGARRLLLSIKNTLFDRYGE